MANKSISPAVALIVAGLVCVAAALALGFGAVLVMRAGQIEKPVPPKYEPKPMGRSDIYRAAP